MTTEAGARPPAITLPVVVFVLATLTFSVGLLALQEPAGVDQNLISLVQFGPALGAATVALAFRRSRRWAFRLVTGLRRAPFRGVVPAVAAVVLLAATAGIAAAAGIPLSVAGLGDVGPPVAALLVAQFVGACGEELGWRCLLQPTLRLRAGPVTTGLTVGLLWGAWHVQVFALGPLFVAGFLAGTVGMSVLLAVLLDADGTPVLIGAGIFHFLVNIGLLVLGDEESGDPGPVLALGGAALALAALVVLLTRRRSGAAGLERSAR